MGNKMLATYQLIAIQEFSGKKKLAEHSKFKIFLLYVPRNPGLAPQHAVGLMR